MNVNHVALVAKEPAPSLESDPQTAGLRKRADSTSPGAARWLAGGPRA